MKRREFLGKLAGGIAGMALGGVHSFAKAGGPYIKKGGKANKVIVLGLDGMDPKLLTRFAREGAMPNFKQLIKKGGFKPLGTSLPPQSPVAWSNFITGMNPGGHGIFDFIHRDPVNFIPYLSTTQIQGSSRELNIGNWVIPMGGGKVELLRKGPAFWKFLEERDIPATIFKIPANFPPVECKSKTISGMGTPDLLGTYGTFSYYTDFPPENADEFSGGNVYPIKLENDQCTAKLIGPANSLRKDRQEAAIAFTVFRDSGNHVAKIVLQGHEIILNQGEWSSWINVDFEMIPYLQNLFGICRFFLKEVHPHIKLYVTPINIDPANPSMTICTPEDYSGKLCEAVGPFYTQGFPEDTKALSNGVFDDEEYLVQANMVLSERIRLFEHEFNNFSDGLFFFYFSSIDQNSHMLLRTMDENHPLHNSGASPQVKGAIKNFYKTMDNVLKQTMRKVDNNTTLIVLSDHGFAPFYKEFHLSTWLVENGYTKLLDPTRQDEGEFFDNVDWSKTKAYAMGINSLYINQRGREFDGAVDPAAMPQLVDEIKSKLEAQVDPDNGQKVVAKAYKPQEAYSGKCVDQAPELIVGYHPGYRISDTATLGKFPKKIIESRKDKWSADHCMDPRAVPGVLLSNKRITKESPALEDLASTILQEFGIEHPTEIEKKKPVFEI